MQSSSEAMSVCLLIASVGLCISSLELLFSSALSSNKLTTTIFHKNIIYRTVSILMIIGNNSLVLRVVVILRLLSCLLLAGSLLLNWNLSGLFVVLIVTSNVVISTYKQVGNDGADQMNNIIFISAVFFFLFPSQAVKISAILFIAGQSLLSYFTAGLAKLLSPIWLKTNAVGSILGSLSYGQPFLYRTLQKWQWLGRLLSIFIVAFEVLLPFCILLPTNYCIAALILAAFFHINCGIVMGLNDFIWAFVATYPTILWTNKYLYTHVF